jgi:hypothetical protein
MNQRAPHGVGEGERGHKRCGKHNSNPMHLHS